MQQNLRNTQISLKTLPLSLSPSPSPPLSLSPSPPLSLTVNQQGPLTPKQSFRCEFTFQKATLSPPIVTVVVAVVIAVGRVGGLNGGGAIAVVVVGEGGAPIRDLYLQRGRCRPLLSPIVLALLFTPPPLPLPTHTLISTISTFSTCFSMPGGSLMVFCVSSLSSLALSIVSLTRLFISCSERPENNVKWDSDAQATHTGHMSVCRERAIAQWTCVCVCVCVCV